MLADASSCSLSYAQLKPPAVNQTSGRIRAFKAARARTYHRQSNDHTDIDSARHTALTSADHDAPV
jgi:hypothetical protein